MSSPPGIALGPRHVPFPTSISIEAQAVLKRLVGADGVPINSWHVMPPPEDHDAWVQLQDSVNGQYAAAVAGLAGSLHARIETITAGTATIHVATPDAADRPERATLDFHGGALVLGGGEACRAATRMQADQHEATCYGVDYRMPPEHPFPAALDDGLAAYRFALDRHDPRAIVVSGRSAGGNLAVATLLRARAEGLPMPAALVLLSPELDLTESGDSFAVNAGIDVALPGSLMAANLLYAGGADLADPALSPLFAADLAGLPPTFLQSGTRDLFLSNAVRFHRRLRAAGVAAELHVFEAMPHGGFGGGTPEDADLAAEVARFAAAHWPR